MIAMVLSTLPVNSPCKIQHVPQNVSVDFGQSLNVISGCICCCHQQCLSRSSPFAFCTFHWPLLTHMPSTVLLLGNCGSQFLSTVCRVSPLPLAQQCVRRFFFFFVLSSCLLSLMDLITATSNCIYASNCGLLCLGWHLACRTQVQIRFLSSCSDTLLMQRSVGVWMHRVKQELAAPSRPCCSL